MHKETVADTDGPPGNTLEEVAAGRIVPKSVLIYERKARASSLQTIGIEFTFYEDSKHAAYANNATTISGNSDGTGVEQTFDALPGHAIPNQYAYVPNTSFESHNVNMSTAQHHEFEEEVVTSLSLPSPRQLAGWPNASGTYLSPGPDRSNMLGIGNAYDTGGWVAPQPLSSGERQYSHVFQPSQPPEQHTPMSEVFLTPNEGFTPFSPATSITTLDSDGRDDQLLETPDLGGNTLDRLVLLSPTATPSTLASSPGDIGGYTYTTPSNNPYLYPDHVPGDVPTYRYTPNKCGNDQSECIPSHPPSSNVQDQFANTNTIDNQTWNWGWLEINNPTIYNPANPTVDDGRDNQHPVNVQVASNTTNTANVLNVNDPSSFNVQGAPSIDFGHAGWFDALFSPSFPGTAGYSGATYPPLDPTSDPSTHQVPDGSYHQSNPPSQLVGPFSSPTQFIPPTSTNTPMFVPTSSPVPTPSPIPTSPYTSAPGLSLAARLSSPNHSPAGPAYVHHEDSSEGSAGPLSLYDRIYNYKRAQKRPFPLNKQMLMQYIADGMSVTKLFPYTNAGSRGGNPTTPSQVLSDDGEQDLDQDNDADSPRSQGPFICHGTHRLSKKPEAAGEWERMICVTSSKSLSAYQKHIKTVHLGLNHRQLSLLKWLTDEGFYASTCERTGKPAPTSLIQNRAICVVHLRTGEEPREQWLASSK